jgi:hypothetical protein
MITTVDHALLYDLLYFSSDKFIAAAIELAVTQNYDGFNIDWEVNKKQNKTKKKNLTAVSPRTTCCPTRPATMPI